MTALRPLPHVRFESVPEERPGDLPRMDVAGFVGLAERGPFDVPVAVHDLPEFEQVFGRPPVLAWDPVQQRAVSGMLHGTVAAFFAHGGRRCWVVRAGSDAPPTRFPLPGVLGWDEDGSLSPAVARGSSPGTWADSYEVGCALRVEALGVMHRPLMRADEENGERSMTWSVLGAPPSLATAGALLQMQVPAHGRIGLMVIDRVTRLSDIPALEPDGTERQALAEGQALALTFGTRFWFEDGQRLLAEADGWVPLAARWLEQPAGVPLLSGPSAWLDSAVDARAPWSGWRLEIAHRPALGDEQAVEPPRPGTMLHASFTDGERRRELWVSVVSSEIVHRPDGDLPETIVVMGVGGWLVVEPPGDALLPGTPVSRVTFECRLAERGSAVASSSELGFARPDARAWFIGTPARSGQSVESNGPPRGVLPFSGQSPGPSVHGSLPIGMDRSVDRWLPSKTSGAPLDRLGAGHLGWHSFVDERLAGVSSWRLAHEAGWLAADADPPRGLHALFALHEVAAIAIPDAALPIWQASVDPRECRFEHPVDAVAGAAFAPCLPGLPPPDVRLSVQGDTIHVSWQSIGAACGPGETLIYDVEIATEQTWRDARLVYSGPARSVTLVAPRRCIGVRVRARCGSRLGEWSSGSVDVVPLSRRVVSSSTNGEAPYPTVALHRAMLRFAAARGDVLALLSWPRHATLSVGRMRQIIVGPGGDLSLTPAEAVVLDHGVAHHPHVMFDRVVNNDRWLPPDGAVAGRLAAASWAGRPWLSGANEVWPATLALEPTVERTVEDGWQRAQINAVRRSARGIVTLGADTLSPVEALRPIAVRRVLGLVRRLIARVAEPLVFEAASGALAARLERTLADKLQRLYRSGALAGGRPEDAYFVRAGIGREGELIAEIGLAPARPVEFIVLRLVRAEGSLALDEPGVARSRS